MPGRVYLPLSVDVCFSKSGSWLAILELSLGVLAFLKLIGKLVVDTGFRLFDDAKFVGTFFTAGPLGVAASVYADGLFFLAESSIFPSDALGGSPLVDFPFYPGLGSSFYGSSVTPVR